MPVSRPVPPPAVVRASAPPAEQQRTLVAFRPMNRPPMAVVCLLDDCKDTGEEFRVRGDRFVIGRSEGDAIVSHDSAMSGRHVELVRVFDNGRYRWYVADLDSTNGTFARVGEAVLRHNQEILLGSRRYRFDFAPQAAPPPTNTPERKATMAWSTITTLPSTEARPSLVELTAQGEGPRLTLPSDEVTLGTDARQSSLVLPHDALVGACHARLFRDKSARWVLKGLDRTNGIWVRIKRIELHSSAQFQIGEQRFAVSIL